MSYFFGVKSQGVRSGRDGASRAAPRANVVTKQRADAAALLSMPRRDDTNLSWSPLEISTESL